jgi:DNA-binding response OmpR family regulator
VTGPGKTEDLRRPAAGPRVLVADDDPGTRGLMLIYLKQLGFTADSVSNGREALDAVATGIYGLLLLDYVMPEIEGPEVARRVRAMEFPLGQPGIVAFSALGRPGVREDCLAAGMDSFVPKPFTEAELREALEVALERRVPRRPAAVALAGEAKGRRGEPPRVILVDDDASVRQFVWQALTTAGYEVVQVASGEDARWLLDGATRPYDLLVVDVVLPGMKGPEFARWLSSQHPSTRVLFISGFPEETARGFGLPEAECEFLPKPFGVKELLRRVEDILRDRPTGKPSPGGQGPEARPAR